MISKKQKTIFWIILISQIFLLLIFVFFRLIDYDEGSYLSAARSVRQGNLPYLDFFYPQMPYLPYAYCLVSQYGFSSLFLGRLISALAGIFLSLILFWFVYKFTKDTGLSLLAFFLYSLHGLTINWHSVVKTLAFSDLFAFISFVFFAWYLFSKENNKYLKVFLSGIFIGISYNFRLTFFFMFLLEGIMIFVLTSPRTIQKKILDVTCLFSGAILSSSLAIFLFFKNPTAFIFGNIGYHQVWGLKSIRMTLTTKIVTLGKFVFYPQDLFLLALTTISIIWLVQRLWNKKKATSEDNIILLTCAISLMVVSVCFFMSPTQFQYYEQALPYILISSLPALGKLQLYGERKKIIIPAIASLYLLFLIPFIMIFLFISREKDKSFQIREVKKVTQVVQENSKPGEMILSGWPAYAVLSNREAVPGLETWGWEIIPFMTTEEKDNLKLIDSSGIEQVIWNKKVRLIVDEPWFLSNFENLIQANYDLIKVESFVKIYTKRD